MIDGKVKALVDYAVAEGLIEAEDRTYCINGIIAIFGKNDFDDCAEAATGTVAELLDTLCDEAVEMGLIDSGSVSRDLFDTKIMGVLTPRPSEVIKKFRALYNESPEKATDWYYKLSGDTNYIRRDRISQVAADR